MEKHKYYFHKIIVIGILFIYIFYRNGWQLKKSLEQLQNTKRKLKKGLQKRERKNNSSRQEGKAQPTKCVFTVCLINT